LFKFIGIDYGVSMADYGDQVFAAEAITKKRLTKGKTEYLVKWKGEVDMLRL
jgi:hypothetical protein